MLHGAIALQLVSQWRCETSCKKSPVWHCPSNYAVSCRPVKFKVLQNIKKILARWSRTPRALIYKFTNLTSLRHHHCSLITVLYLSCFLWELFLNLTQNLLLIQVYRGIYQEQLKVNLDEDCHLSKCKGL